MRGLIVKSPYIEEILGGTKKLEIRGSNTHIRGKIALIKSGSSRIFGTVNIVDSKELSFDEYKEWKISRGASKNDIIEKPYKRIYAWVLEEPVKLEEPIVYKHPMGAVIWVNLNDYDI